MPLPWRGGSTTHHSPRLPYVPVGCRLPTSHIFTRSFFNSLRRLYSPLFQFLHAEDFESSSTVRPYDVHGHFTYGSRMTAHFLLFYSRGGGPRSSHHRTRLVEDVMQYTWQKRTHYEVVGKCSLLYSRTVKVIPRHRFRPPAVLRPSLPFAGSSTGSSTSKRRGGG